MYPPNGIHMLLLGETGVGKSTFASLVYDFAREIGCLSIDSPMVTFNCADYANNPQLLLSQIFGVKKGAYTGADSDKVGLIEKANNGILFLDEVHRLPSEGQEIFFTFIDKGTYRRLGETEDVRKSNVLIICATTETPEGTLLNTFRRRIPMVINIPNLRERGLEERFNLVSQFFREESAKLSKSIKVSVNTMKAFIGYHCPNNIGQLKTDIQLTCAKAYVNFISKKKDEITINTMDLSPNVRNGLYSDIEHRKLWNKLIGINNRFLIFDENEITLFNDEKDRESIYDMIDIRLHELKTKGIDKSKLDEAIEKDVNEYLNQYIYNATKKNRINNLENIISDDILKVVNEIIDYYQESTGKELSDTIHYCIAVHIANSFERINKNQKIINPQLSSIRTKYKREFELALNCIRIIERVLDISMPIDEAGFLTMFFGPMSIT